MFIVTFEPLWGEIYIQVFENSMKNRSVRSGVKKNEHSDYLVSIDIMIIYLSSLLIDTENTLIVLNTNHSKHDKTSYTDS